MLITLPELPPNPILFILLSAVLLAVELGPLFIRLGILFETLADPAWPAAMLDIDCIKPDPKLLTHASSPFILSYWLSPDSCWLDP